MVYDSVENLTRYMNEEDAQRILDFVMSVDAQTEKGRHEIDGERLYAIVSEYRTKSREEAVLEAHNRYLDLHFMFFGEEKNEFYSRSDCKIKVDYDESCEAALYQFPEKRNEVILTPGFFALYFTDDAHAPQLAVEAPITVRKIVVKALKSDFEKPPLFIGI